MPDTYHASTSLPQFLQYPLEGATTGTVRVAIEVLSSNGAWPSLSSASIDIIRPDGTLAVDDQAATVATTELSYNWTMTAADESLSTGYQVRWRFVIANPPSSPWPTTEIIQRAHIVRHVLDRPSAEQDLLDRHPELEDMRPASQESWERVHQTAWETVQRRLINMGRRPWLVLDPSALHDCTVLLALSRVFRTCSTFAGNISRYAELSAQYADEYETEWGRLQFVYDMDDDGLEGGGEEATASSPVIFLSKTPSTWWK